MRDILVIEHRDYPVADRGQLHLAERGFNVRRSANVRGEPLPELDENTAGMIVMGGPQNMTQLDEFPFLIDEMKLAERAMEKGIPLLGICLGAQMIAHALGAHVGDHPDGHVAFGYYEVVPTAEGKAVLPAGLHAPAGNAQGFDLPAGATLLAQGELFPNQAYRVGSTVCGLQFHPEVTRSILDIWHVVLGDKFAKPGAQDQETQNRCFSQHDAALHDWYTGFLDNMFAAD